MFSNQIRYELIYSSSEMKIDLKTDNKPSHGFKFIEVKCWVNTGIEWLGHTIS